MLLQDNGKPVAVARAADIPLSVAHFRYFAGWADKITGAAHVDGAVQLSQELMVQRYKLKRISYQQNKLVCLTLLFLLTGRTIPLDGMLFGYTLREPIGVVGAVIPCAFSTSPQQE